MAYNTRKPKDKLQRLVEECMIVSDDDSLDSDWNDNGTTRIEQLITSAAVHTQKLSQTKDSARVSTIRSREHDNETGHQVINNVTADIVEEIDVLDIVTNSQDNTAIYNEIRNMSLNPETGILEDVSEYEMIIESDIVVEAKVDTASQNEVSVQNTQDKEVTEILNEETGNFEMVEVEIAPASDNRKGKKRRLNPKSWKKNKTKADRLKQHEIRPIPTCRCKCKEKLTVAECIMLHDKLINMSSHTEQNIFLQGCIKENHPKRFRPRQGVSRSRLAFQYTLQVSDKNVTLCANAFLAIFGITRQRLRKKVMRYDMDISDGRGRHSNHFRKLSFDILKLVRDFISNLPATASHYTRSDNKRRKYISADLSIAELHRRFLSQHSNLSNTVSYEKFREIFNFDFNISFGTPRKDICNTCEKLKVNIQSAELEKRDRYLKKLQVEKELHLRRAEVFFSKLKQAENNKDDSHLAICFDYQKNLPLPVTNIQDEYYRRQLWLHNFGIHNIKDKTAVMYLHTENYAQKGPNEVITALNHYLTQKKESKHKKLTIFCDNCFSQNKNKYLFTYLDQLCVSGNFDEVTIVCPVPGHSMMPIDRDFAQIERKRLRKQTIYSPEHYVDMIKSSRNVKPYEVVFLEKCMRRNDKGEPVIKVKDYKKLYEDCVKSVPGIAKTREVHFHKINRVSLRSTMTGPFTKCALYRVGVGRYVRKDPDDAYNGPIGLKPGKVNDIIHLLNFVPNNEKYYYEDNIFPKVNVLSEDISDEEIFE